MAYSKPRKARPVLEPQNAHICQWDFTILSSEQCCFLLTWHHNWWDGLFLWKIVQSRLKLQGSSGDSPLLPRMQLKDEDWTFGYLCQHNHRQQMHSKCQYTRKALHLNKVNIGADDGRWGSASLDLHFPIAPVPVRREVSAEGRSPGSKRNCMDEANA